MIWTKALLLCLTLSVAVKGEEEKETNPFVEAAQSFLEEVVKNKPDGNEGGLGALVDILQTFGQNDAGKHLTSIVDLFNKKGGYIDPSIIGQVASAFANNAERSGKADVGQEEGVDWSAMMGLASNFLSRTKDSNDSGLEGFLNLLPLLTNGIANHLHFADNELEDAEEHKKYEKSSFLPPFLNVLYEYWEHFKQSELGHTLWNKSGLEGIFQLFVDKDGYFQVDRIFQSMENSTFRRRWIKSLSSFVAGWVKHISDPVTQVRYLANIQFIGNGFLKAQGYSKAVQFDLHRPIESLSFLADAIAKRQFGLKINSSTYVKPAVAYIQDLFKLGQSKGLTISHLSTQEISGKLAEMLNGDVIEPVLRVWRVYTYSIKNPNCDRHLICALNVGEPDAKNGIKPGIVKLSSLIASWYMSGRTGTPFWKLYNAATENHNCQTKYPVDCSDFFDHDRKVTTEYKHNEL